MWVFPRLRDWLSSKLSFPHWMAGWLQEDLQNIWLSELFRVLLLVCMKGQGVKNFHAKLGTTACSQNCTVGQKSRDKLPDLSHSEERNDYESTLLSSNSIGINSFWLSRLPIKATYCPEGLPEYRVMATLISLCNFYLSGTWQWRDSQPLIWRSLIFTLGDKRWTVS